MMSIMDVFSLRHKTCHQLIDVFTNARPFIERCGVGTATVYDDVDDDDDGAAFITHLHMFSSKLDNRCIYLSIMFTFI